MDEKELKHTVYVRRNGNAWESGYFNRHGEVEAVQRDIDTLHKARQYAAGVWGDVYHGTNNYIRSYPARPKKFPEEYPGLPMRTNGSSAVELILPNSEGYHIDGKPISIVKGLLKQWLDEDIQEDRERILTEAIRDLSAFSEKNLERTLRETELAFFQKQDEARDQAKQKVAKVRKEAIESEKTVWIFFYAPIVALIAFFLGRVSNALF
ncbi:hypothetical protein [Paracoccus sediminicola]|uniref:hypothetical protein n=1 Tax=Paracoccus sediminicola TaxID=3017783 RepID=UPI0022F080BC|nr:hypothetical protein [Paracoccus sediminicola]WBU58728.1 hypothetical protein PAF18_17125 [Paracoccus sediminicola]